MEENISNPNVDDGNEMVTAEPLLPLPKELEHLKARENFIEEGHGENFNNDESTLQVSPYFKIFRSPVITGDLSILYWSFCSSVFCD